jgi:predicted aldo/keto reductase-like oxidoreductase
MSGHGGQLVECLDYAIDNDLVDVVLVSYNFGQDPGFLSRFTRGLDFVAVQRGLPRVLAKAKQKDVGVVAMKTLRGGRLNDMRPYEHAGATFAQAALRWTLAQSHTDALIISMTSHKLIEEYLGASGWQAPTKSDLRLLERYYVATADTQCRYGCSECESACPHGVPIADVLRTRMYDRDYGDRELARDDYAQLGVGAAPCLTCSEPTCASACPIGLRIPELTRSVHGRLAPPA